MKFAEVTLKETQNIYLSIKSLQITPYIPQQTMFSEHFVSRALTDLCCVLTNAFQKNIKATNVNSLNKVS